MGVLKLQPALFENRVLPMPSMPTHLFPSMAVSEHLCNQGRRVCRGENMYCVALHRKQSAGSSLGEMRAGSVCFKLRLAKEELGC